MDELSSFKKDLNLVESQVHPFARFKVGSPTSKLQVDDEWDEYCQAIADKMDLEREHVHDIQQHLQGLNETGNVFPERSGFAPAEISLKALTTQLGSYGEVEDVEANIVEDKVREWMLDIDQKWIGSFRTLTFEEAINGVSDKDGTLEKMDLSKSPGFGFSLLHHDKRGWVFENLAELKEAVQWALDHNQNMGEVVLHFLKGSEKDEKRDFDRVLLHKTRLFMASSIVDVIVSRMLFGDYVRKFIGAGKHLGFYSAAGMEIYDGRWNEFIKHMTWNYLHIHMWPGDIAKYDKKYPHSWHYEDGMAIASLCRDEWAKPMIIRQFRANSVAPCVLTIAGYVFIRPKDNPSGSLMTTVGNTRGVMRKLLRTWYLKAGEQTTLHDFFEFVRNKIIGDDLALNLKPGSPMSYDDVIQEFAKNGWEMAIPLGCQERLDDSYFAGRRSVLVQVSNYEIFLPVIDRDRILAINEFRKGKRDALKRLMRAYAAVEMAFPLLFEEDEYLFAVLYDYFLFLCKEGLKSEWTALNATARGLPTLSAVWKLYTGENWSPDYEMSQLLQRQRRLAGERSEQYQQARQALVLEPRSHSW